MKTEIFKDYLEFSNRKDKEVNGVSSEFAKDNPNYEKENKRNEGCWNCRDCSDCSDCIGCRDCSDCIGCSDCVGKNNLSAKQSKDKKEKHEFPEVPKIENVHQKVFAAASDKGALDMRNWHTCETTHCRAGWVVTLAGKEGRNLEEKTSTLFAAMQIYKASSSIRVYPPRFFDENEKALEDMKQCSEKELEG